MRGENSYIPFKVKKGQQARHRTGICSPTRTQYPPGTDKTKQDTVGHESPWCCWLEIDSYITPGGKRHLALGRLHGRPVQQARHPSLLAALAAAKIETRFCILYGAANKGTLHSSRLPPDGGNRWDKKGVGRIPVGVRADEGGNGWPGG